MTFLAAWQFYAPPDLPQPVKQVQFDKNRNWHLDFGFPARKVAVELNCSADQEREKYNLAAAMGWRILHFTSVALEAKPQDCIDLTVKALGLL